MRASVCAPRGAADAARPARPDGERSARRKARRACVPCPRGTMAAMYHGHGAQVCARGDARGVRALCTSGRRARSWERAYWACVNMARGKRNARQALRAQREADRMDVAARCSSAASSSG